MMIFSAKIISISLVIFQIVVLHSVEVSTQGQLFPKKFLRPINIFYISSLNINNVKNGLIDRSIKNAFEYLRDEYPGYVGSVYNVIINDSQDASESICTAWDRYIQNGPEKSPDLIFDATVYGKQSRIIEVITATLGVPTISVQIGHKAGYKMWKSINPNETPHLVYITPLTDSITQISRIFAADTKISNAAILYDENFVMDNKYYNLLLNIQVRHIMLKLKVDIESVKSQLQKLDQYNIGNVFVFGNNKIISICLNAAAALGYMTTKYAWYTISLNYGTPNCFDCNSATYLSFERQKKNMMNVDFHDHLYSKFLIFKPFLVTSFYFEIMTLAVRALRNAMEEGLWNPKSSHIGCDHYDSNGVNTSNTNVLDSYLDPNLDLLNILRNFSESDNFLSLFDNYHWETSNGNNYPEVFMTLNLINIKKDHAVNTTIVGNWTTGWNSPLQVSDMKFIKNHTALTNYIVATKIKSPFVMYDNVTNKWSGLCIDLLNKLKIKLKFNYQLYLAKDKRDESGDTQVSWNGLIRDVQTKKADMAIGSLSVTAKREELIDFTVPYYDFVGITILMAKPKVPKHLFKFLTVFQTDLWLFVLGSYFCCSFTIWVFDKYSPFSFQNNKEKYKNCPRMRVFDIKECFWFCFTSITPQGGGDMPRNLSGKFVSYIWWLYSFLLIVSYTANLAAVLTTDRLHTPVSSLNDLSRQNAIHYATLYNTMSYQYFQRMRDVEQKFHEMWINITLNETKLDKKQLKLAVWNYPLDTKYRKIFGAMKTYGFPKSTEEAVARIRNSSHEFALIEESTTLRYLAETNCDLTIIGEEFSQKPYSIAVQQGSPLKNRLNRALLDLLSRRELEILKNKWWNKISNCEKPKDEDDKITINNIGGLFILILIGIGLACVALVAEYYYYYRRHNAIQPFQSDMQNDNDKPEACTKIVLQHRPAPTDNLENLFKKEENRLQYRPGRY